MARISISIMAIYDLNKWNPGGTSLVSKEEYQIPPYKKQNLAYKLLIESGNMNTI